MPALVAGIHVLMAYRVTKTWMAGSSPAMTSNVGLRLSSQPITPSFFSVASTQLRSLLPSRMATICLFSASFFAFAAL